MLYVRLGHTVEVLRPQQLPEGARFFKAAAPGCWAPGEILPLASLGLIPSPHQYCFPLGLARWGGQDAQRDLGFWEKVLKGAEAL